jgi:hypothetical protein
MGCAIGDQYGISRGRLQRRAMIRLRNLDSAAECVFDEFCQENRWGDRANTVQGWHATLDAMKKCFVLSGYTISERRDRSARRDAVLFDCQ